MNTARADAESPDLPPITSSVSEAKRHVVEYGVARLAGVMSPADVAVARERLLEQAEAERELDCAKYDRAGNQRVRNLINKGEIFRRLPTTPAVLEYVRALLGKDVLLSSMSGNIQEHGSMGMHADQAYVGAVPFVVATAVVWMLTDFTEENGGTLVIPGSHRWTGFSEMKLSTQPRVATGPAGTLLLLDGRTWHDTGINKTGRPRPALITYYVKPFLRQEENYALSLCPQVMQRCSRELLSLLGFEVWFVLGGIDGSGPGSFVSARPTTFSGELRPRGASAGTLRNFS
jgi:ectoine hydroxylase-related dioxygenase (phytanoyl-CoA dioxygenase family)